MKKPNEIRNITAIGISLILALAGDQTLYAVLPTLAANGMYPFARIGILLSANRFIRLLANPVVGSWLNKRARKTFLLVGLAIGAASPILYAFGVTSFWIFLLGRLLWGIAFSLMYITSITIVMDITNDKNRGWGSGLLQTFYFAGLAFTPLLGGFLNDLVGFQNGLLICSALGWISLLIAWIFVDETHQTQEATLPEGLPHRNFSLQEVIFQTTNRFREAIAVLDKETGAACYVYMLSSLISEGIIMATISLFLVEEYGGQITLGGWVVQAATAGGAALAFRSLTSAVSSPLVGWVSDRSSNRWVEIWTGNLLGVIGLILIALVHHPISLIMGLFLVALNSGIILTGMPALLARKNGFNTGLLIGWMATSVDIGLSLAPMISYLLLGIIPLSTLYLLGAGLVATSLPYATRYAFFSK